MKLIKMTDYVIKQSLIQMTDYVAKQRELKNTDNIRRFWNCERYAKFLKQIPCLCMFVPCKFINGIWVALEEPYTIFTNDSDEFDEYIIEYCKAKELILFNGFEYDKTNGGIKKGRIYDRVWISEIDLIEMTIEDLIKYNLELTPAAKKQFNI